MHAFVPRTPQTPTGLDLASHADRIAHGQRDNRLALVFSAITAVSLGVMTTKMVLDMVREDRERHRTHGRER